MFFAPVIGVMKQAENLNDVLNKATARTNLDVPTRAGGNASGTWGVSISGNAATVTTVTSAQVADGNAALAAGGVGTYAFMKCPGVGQAPGYTAAGSTLRFTDAEGVTNGSVPSGTWRLMGQTTGGSTQQETSLWLRIA